MIESYSMSESAGVLEGEGVLAAVTALCGTDRSVAEQLQRGFHHLVSSGDWSSETGRLERFGLSARYHSGQLRDALEIPGDIVLLRNRERLYSLLHRMEQRWHYLAADGAPLADKVVGEEGDSFEAVVVSMPRGATRADGFASIASIWPHLRAAWAEVGIASLFMNSGQLLLPLFTMLIYDKVAQNGLFETLWALTLGMVLYLATDAGMRLVRSWTTERISADLTLRSDETLWSKLVAQVELPPGGFPRFISNYRDLTLSRDFVSSSYLLTVADIPFLLLYLVVIGLIAWQLMVVALILATVYCIGGLVLQERQNRLSREAEKSNTLKLTFMGESLGCLDVVRTAPGGGTFLRRWRELAGESAQFDTRRRMAASQLGMFSNFMQSATTIVILVTGVYLIQAQVMSTGRLIACNLLANRAMALVASLFVVTGKWQDFTRAAARMEASLESVAEKEFTPSPEITGAVSVIGVSKRYESRPPALESVSFTIKPGDRIALLGRPGAGKSTLIRCLAGLCRPDNGQILMDGLALDDTSRFDRVRWLAYKAQDPAIFAGTLEENLRISGCRDQARLNEAIWASGLESEFRGGRMSLGMMLDERGNNLSGGQRQKVALARAFAQPSRILLLDEPTLGLDPESEKLLAERLPKLLDSSTVLIMTTHSPVMLQSVQRVIALDGGRVVADGLREKLVTFS